MGSNAGNTGKLINADTDAQLAWQRSSVETQSSPLK